MHIQWKKKTTLELFLEIYWMQTEFSINLNRMKWIFSEVFSFLFRKSCINISFFFLICYVCIQNWYAIFIANEFRFQIFDETIKFELKFQQFVQMAVDFMQFMCVILDKCYKHTVIDKINKMWLKCTSNEHYFCC